MHGNAIAAISTPPGKGGVAVIRISGDGAFDIARKVFQPISGKDIQDYPKRMQIYGHIIYNEEKIDDGMLTLFKAPSSYTGEDTAEISCHGGTLVTRMVLEAVFTAGAAPAEAGEFTRRAFIGGKLSLSEAEAIGTLLDATGEEQIRLAASPSREKLNSEIDGIRAEITDILSSVYARIDYPDEDLGELSDTEVENKLTAVRDRLSLLIDTYKTGRAINEGIGAVIAGKPNVGKSSIYNLLLCEDAAIVTDIAGTTRDVLERRIHLGRVALNISDTAGVRGGNGIDTVERIGISRSKERLHSAELILAVFDASRELDSDDRELLNELESAHGYKLCIINKCDLIDGKKPPFDHESFDGGLFNERLCVSADKDGARLISELSCLVDRLFTDEKISCGNDAIVASARQHSSLLMARGFIDTAIAAYNIGLPSDAASSDIEMALGAIGELDGRSVSESVVNGIFSKFCVGK